MSTSYTLSPWTLGRTGRPSTLAIFHETATARELVAAFADHTVSYADARLMTASREMIEVLRDLEVWLRSDESDPAFGALLKRSHSASVQSQESMVTWLGNRARAAIASAEGEAV